MTAQSLLAAARYPLYRAGHLEPGPPARAQRGGLAHPRAADCLAAVRPERHGPAGTAGASRTRPPRAGAPVALGSRGRGPPGSAGCPVPRRRDYGGRTGCPEARRASPTPPACSGLDAVRIGPGATAPARLHSPARQSTCASCPRRRRLGLPVSGQRQSALAPAPGKAPRRDAGHPLAGPGPALHTLAPAHGQRKHAPPVVGAIARAWSACMGAMATQGARPPPASSCLRVTAKALHGCTVSRQRRRPGVGSPAAA